MLSSRHLLNSSSLLGVFSPRLAFLPYSIPPKNKTKQNKNFTICKIDSQREFAVWLRKLKQGLCINLEGWGGEESGREAQKGGDICIPMADSC